MIPSWNDISIQLRRFMPRLRSGYHESNTDEDLVRQQLLFPYHFARQVSEPHLRTALLYAWIFDTMKWPENFFKTSAPYRALDIGSRHFPYAMALGRLLSSKISGSFELESLETGLDAMYWNGFRRGDAAHYHASLAQQWQAHSRVSVFQGNWLDHRQYWEPWNREISRVSHDEERWDLVFCLFPYIVEDLHRRDGLSLKAFDPRAFYRKLFSSTSSIVLFHQGQEELDLSLKLLEDTVPTKWSTAMPTYYIEKFQENPWIKRRFPIYSVVVRHLCADLSKNHQEC